MTAKKRTEEEVKAEEQVSVEEPHTEIDVAAAEVEEKAQVEGDLNAIAEKVEDATEKKESPASYKERMKQLREKQKKEMAELKEAEKKRKEEAKAQGKPTGEPKNTVNRNTVTARTIAALTETIKFDDLAIRCDNEYVAASEGHKSNIREARTVLRNNLIVAPIFSKGRIKVEGDTISVVPQA